MTMNEKNVLAIFGSPHTNGMTAAMFDCAVHKAEERGYTVRKVNLYEKNISFCKGLKLLTEHKNLCYTIQPRNIISHTDTFYYYTTLFWLCQVANIIK